MRYLNFRLKKLISILVSTIMVLDLLLLPISLYAQEVGQEPTPTPTESSTSMVTGDASSSASSENDVNINETPTNGTVEGISCGVDVSVECPVETTNEAIVEQDTSAQSTSGENEASASAQSDISTGDASAEATSVNIVNENVIVATDEAALEPTPEATLLDENSDENSNEINIENNATLETNTTAGSTSGDNQNSADQTLIDTGDAIALANQFNLLNTNIIGSNFSFIIINITGEYLGDIDLNTLWLALLEQFNPSLNSTNNTQTDVNLENSAEVNVTSQATSLSGENASQGDETVIDTGNALAVSNILNVINLNVIGSRFLLPIINIFGTLNGNIILPSKERFLTTPPQNVNSGEIDITNIVEISSQVNSDADSGENNQEGSNLGLEAGDAIAQGSSTNYLNLNILKSNWYKILINNFGFWLGGDGEATAELSVVQDPQGGDENSDSESEGSNISIFNIARIEALSEALAISGGNQTSGNFSRINSGWARSLSNIFNLVNTNIIGSNFMMPLITVFNTWNGDTEYAYPDLAISINADKNIVHDSDTVTYNVSFTNNGKDVAQNSTIQAILPQGEEYANGDSHAQGSGQVINLSLGTVNPGEGGSFSFQSSFRNPNSSATEFTTLAYITSSDEESDDTNNSSSTTKKLETGDGSSADTDSNKSPRLELSSKTNIGEFVYAGDIVTFEVTIRNSGDGVSKTTLVHQSVYDEFGQEVSYNEFKLADIDPNAERKLSFGLKIPDQATSGTYRSVISAEGKADNGDTVSSNTAENSILVKGKFFGFAGSVQAAESKIKETFNKKDIVKEQTDNYWAYIIAAFLIGAWLFDINRHRIALVITKRKKKDEEPDLT